MRAVWTAAEAEGYRPIRSTAAAGLLEAIAPAGASISEVLPPPEAGPRIFDILSGKVDEEAARRLGVRVVGSVLEVPAEVYHELGDGEMKRG